MIPHRRFGHDDPERRKWQNPEETLKNIGLKPGFSFVDVGCGSGFFALPAAAIVGSRGRVYGVDVDSEAIDELKREASRRNLENLVLKIGRAEDVILCERCADIVFFGIDFHDFQDQIKVLHNARKMLKPEGRLIDLDWKKEPMDVGPPSEIRFSQKKAVGLIEAASFKVETVRDSGSYHYIITARP